MSTALQPGQLVALQTLWSKFARRSLDVPRDRDREARLEWAAKNVGHQVASFKELTREEAAKLIDTLQLSLGREPNNWQSKAGQSQDRARAAGTHGRRTSQSNEHAIASASDIARIQNAVARLGWSPARFESWLMSARSPLRKRSSRTIRTVADANKVWWGLKPLLKKSGLWQEQKKDAKNRGTN